MTIRKSRSRRKAAPAQSPRRKSKERASKKRRPLSQSKTPKLRPSSKSKRGRLSKSDRKKIDQGLRLQFALRILGTEKSVSVAARKAGIDPRKLRSVAIKNKILIRRGKRWIIQRDVPRRLLIYSGGKEHVITASKFRTASLIGRYMAAVRWFVQTNGLHHLEPFVGKSVKDISGKRFPLETRPNVLHRLANSGGDTFEQVYRIVV